MSAPPRSTLPLRPSPPVWLAAALGLALLLPCACAPMQAGPLPGQADAAAQVDAAPADQAVATPDVATGPKPLPPGDPVQLVANDQYWIRALDVIQTAQTRLDIVQFEAKTGDVIDTLVGATILAHQRGVVVRVLLDDEIESNHDVVAKLKAQGVQAKLDSTKVTTHAKILLSEQGYLVGSTNWSETSITSNNETNVLVRDPAARKAMAGYVDALWNNSASKATVKPGTAKTAAVYGDGGYEQIITPLLDGAKKRIVVCTYGMNLDPKYADGPVMQAAERLGQAVARGVEVKVIMDLSGSWNATGNAINRQAAEKLLQMGVQVRLDPVEKITHAKFLVADDAVVLGTNNWGFGGFELNHESGVRTHEAKVVSELNAYFDKLWAKSKAP